MPYERLLKSNRIKPHRVSQNEVKQLLHLANRDLSTAMRNLLEQVAFARDTAGSGGVYALRTDRNGWIELTTDEEQMWVEVEKR